MSGAGHRGQHVRLPVNEASRVAEARRIASACAARLGFDDAETGRVALIATEMATNLVKHARDGELLVRELPEERELGLELLAIDRGPGIGDVARSLRDGYSSAGSPGTGLGAIARGADEFDIDSRVGHGTVLMARLCAKPKRHCAVGGDERTVLGAVCLPIEGEHECGDAWSVRRIGTVWRIIVADGVGHGPLAASAADAALAAAELQPHASPAATLEAMHKALRRTRGAAVTVVQIDSARDTLHYAGIGNVTGTIVGAAANRHLVSHNGTLGHNVRAIHEMTERWSPGDLLVLHTDGLGSRWALAGYPGLAGRHPSVVAAVLYRDLKRGHDDVTVVAIKRGTSA